MRRNAATRSENPFRGDHAAQVFRRRFDAREHDLFAALRARYSFLRAENDVTAGCAWSGGQAAADFFRSAHRVPVKDWREEMRERIGRNPSHGVLFTN